MIFATLIAVLIFCSIKSFKSHKKIARAVGVLDLSLIPPMIGNLIIIGSTVKLVSMVGCYIYFIGMDAVAIAMTRFTSEYCRGAGIRKNSVPVFVYIAIAADIVQLLMNPFFGHAFDLEEVEVQGYAYYRVIPYMGQTVHRIVDYTIFLGIIMVSLVVIVNTAKIYRERYTVIFVSMLVVVLWQTFYIFSRTPVDRSMIGYGVFGVLVYYLSIRYRPLRLLDRMLSSIAANMTEALFVYDPTGKCIWANQTGLKLTNVNDDEIERVSESLIETFGSRPFTKNDWCDEMVIGSGDDARYYQMENHFVSESRKYLAGSYLIIRDRTEEQKRLRRELYNSTHDSLTDLYSKQHLFECIRKKLESDIETKYIAVFVDVKNFKIVNDIFNTRFGDKALQQIADWIRKNTNEKCLTGRLAGDTFGIFMQSEIFEEDKKRIEQELRNFVVSDANIEHRLLIHLGVYEIDDRSLNVSVMFDRAHSAISSITGNYKEHIAYYDKELREKLLWDQKISAGLTEAIDGMQIRPYLQPITDRSGKVVGAEALARWIHPKQGFMSPGVFIPVLEKNGLIVEVDRHIWHCACEILASWKNKHDDMFISVNISPKDFYYIDIVAEITGLVKKYQIEPKKLRVEITETVMMTDVQEKFKMLDELRKAGFIVEMDDFGSGFSSLNLLKDMPVDVLKIDMKFLSGSDDSKKAQTIVKNIIRLSEELNIISLTEGVETVQQYSELSKMGCKLFQGFYFAKPLSREDFEEFAFAKAS